MCMHHIYYNLSDVLWTSLGFYTCQAGVKMRHKCGKHSYNKQQGLILWVVISNEKENVSLALVAVLNQSLIDVMLFGVLQDVEETQVDSVRLFHDDVQQRLSGFDWTISQRLN